MRHVPKRIVRARARCGYLLWAAVTLAACAPSPGTSKSPGTNQSSVAEQNCLQPLGDISVGFVARSVIDLRLEALQLDNQARAAAIERLFRDAGCERELRSEAVRRAKSPNWICRLPGETSRRIVVGAHYDKVAAGEGAADNWSGTALLPSLLESLGTRARHHTFEFIAFTGEEAGLVGSRYHVRQLDRAQRSEIVAMVNLDTLGLGSTNLERNNSDPRLLCFMARAVAVLHSAVEVVDADRVGTSDFKPFRDVGIPVLSIHSIDQPTLAILHTEQDNLAVIDRDAYYESYRLIALYLALLDEALAQSTDAAAAAAGR